MEEIEEADNIGWEFAQKEQIQVLELGGEYCVRLKTIDGRFWAKGIITITEKGLLPDGDIFLKFTLDTLIDGSPRILDGWDTGWE